MWFNEGYIMNLYIELLEGGNYFVLIGMGVLCILVCDNKL